MRDLSSYDGSVRRLHVQERFSAPLDGGHAKQFTEGVTLLLELAVLFVADDFEKERDMLEHDIENG